jgi:hypothetical protein
MVFFYKHTGKIDKDPLVFFLLIFCFVFWSDFRVGNWFIKISIMFLRCF